MEEDKIKFNIDIETLKIFLGEKELLIMHLLSLNKQLQKEKENEFGKNKLENQGT